MSFGTFVGLLVIALLATAIGVPIGRLIDRKIMELYPTRLYRKQDAVNSAIQTYYTDMHTMYKKLEPTLDQLIKTSNDLLKVAEKELESMN